MSTADQFPDTYKNLPARIFTDSRDAAAFAYTLAVQQVPHRITLVPPRPRFRHLPLKTIVMLLGVHHAKSI